MVRPDGSDTLFLAGFVLGVVGRLSWAAFFLVWAALARTPVAKIFLAACGIAALLALALGGY